MSIPLSEALKFWAKLGLISFGGPAGQIAVLHQELVEKRRWISERRFFHALNYCMILPGPEAQQLVTYIGWLMHRSMGGVLAGSLFILPSFFSFIGLAWIYITFGQIPWIAAIFFGIKPAITAIVLHAGMRIGKRTLYNPILKSIALGSFRAIFLLNLPFPVIVLIAACVGVWGNQYHPEHFSPPSNSSGSHPDAPGEAFFDDHSPRPEHTQFSQKKMVTQGVLLLSCWLIPLGSLIAIFGWETLYPELAWFFTKAAFLTFGGAYAVLPYVYQGAVDHFHWLSTIQMMDGLALGETTPGPLIMIVTFVGFLAGYTQHLIANNHPFWFGVLGATIATWFTFLPSFLFILVGGPLIESSHGKPALAAPLTAISAAVVGVIVNLGLFFAYHVFVPRGFSGQISWSAIFICLMASLALFKYQKGVISVLLASGMAGLLWHLASGLAPI